MKTRWIAACLCAGLLLMVSGYAAPQRPPAGGQPPSEPGGTQQTPAGESVELQGGVTVFRSGINYVRVDAFVTDEDGNPVFDLTRDDFEVYEDGVLQTVDSFQVVQVDPTPQLSGEPLTGVGVTRSDQQLAASRPDVRVFVIFLDDYHVREGNSVRAGRMLVDFIENDLIPTDLVGVMYPLMPVSEVLLTRNHEAVINAIRQFRGVKYDYEVRNLYESRYNMYPTEIVERVRNEVSLSALRGLMTMLGGLREGRKSVLLVSEGYTNYVPPQLRSQVADLRADPAVNPAVLESVRGRQPLRGDDVVLPGERDSVRPAAHNRDREAASTPRCIPWTRAVSPPSSSIWISRRSVFGPISARCASLRTPCAYWPMRPAGGRSSIRTTCVPACSRCWTTPAATICSATTRPRLPQTGSFTRSRCA